MAFRQSLLSIAGFSDCINCSLHSSCISPNIKPDGPLDAKILLVGEAPGKDEDAIGKPFVGKAGQWLNQALAEADLDRNSLLITNTCRCFPKQNEGNKPTKKQWQTCADTHLFPLIKRIQPKVIIAVGSYALEALTGLTEITKRQNAAFEHPLLNTIIVPVVHPSYVMRNQHNKDIYNKFVEGFRVAKIVERLGKPLFDYGEYRTLETIDDLKDIYKYSLEQDRLCCDTETTGLDYYSNINTLTAFGFAFKPRECFLIPINRNVWNMEDFHQTLRFINYLVSNPKLKKIGQNIKFDYSFLYRRYNIKMDSFYADTMLGSFLLNEKRGTRNLSDLTRRYVPELAGYDTTVEILGGAHKVKDPKILSQYCMGDVDATFRIHEIEEQLLEGEGQLELFHNLMMPAAKVLADMELFGVRFDREYLGVLNKKLTTTLTRLDYRMKALPEVKEVERVFGEPFNPRSKQHLSHLLFKLYNLPVIRRSPKTQEPTIDKKILVEYANNFKNDYCTLLQIYRKNDKLRSTYVTNVLKMLPEDDIIHTSYHLDMTETGRTSSDDPSVHTIPKQKDIKSIICARPGRKLIAADFSQSEVRVAAMISQDKALIADCNDLDKDFHRRMASTAFSTLYEEVTTEQRQNAKAVTFGILYGIGANKLAGNIGKSKEEAKAIIREYFNAYFGVETWIQKCHKFIEENHYIISPLGRRRRFPNFDRAIDINDSDDYDRLKNEQAAAKREGTNFVVQVTSSDLMLTTLIRVNRRLEEGRFESKLVIEVHDSLLIDTLDSEIEEVIKLVKFEISNCTQRIGWPEASSVLMKGDIEIGPSWGNMEKIK